LDSKSKNQTIVIKVLKKPYNGDMNEIEIMSAFNQNSETLAGLPELIDWGYVEDEFTCEFLKVKPLSLFIVQKKYGPSIKEIIMERQPR
jgi:hypothetical protein